MHEKYCYAPLSTLSRFAAASVSARSLQETETELRIWASYALAQSQRTISQRKIEKPPLALVKDPKVLLNGILDKLQHYIYIQLAI